MVRVNIVEPKFLADQHLLAEHTEILMLVAYVRANPEPKGIPETYRLGTGHMKFFADKVGYLKRRHRAIRAEMRARGFKSTKKPNLDDVNPALCGDWQPKRKDLAVIKERIAERLARKPGWYRYYGEVRPTKFLVNLISEAKPL